MTIEMKIRKAYRNRKNVTPAQANRMIRQAANKGIPITLWLWNRGEGH